MESDPAMALPLPPTGKMEQPQAMAPASIDDRLAFGFSPLAVAASLPPARRGTQRLHAPAHA
ncbi:hypothetical protein EJB05_31807 [Eragrostis curvula]|uniref:Uncharacterized protein n=1 Tax=Eragrostis curvula TaxID=38414 RepID=A0A5J9UEG9_9POAL|nr:hypothetical protein EJB05_31807 [Eragrostis curvula]